MANLFKKAKEQGATASPKAQKVEIEINEPKFHLMVSRYVELSDQINELSAEASILHAETKERGIAEFTKLYEETGKYPGSFLIKATGMKKSAPASFMMIPTDKYIKIDEDRYNELTAEFGEDVATEETTYQMDSKLVEKYGEIISELITNCKKIKDSDKDKLINAVTSYSVAKGTISDLKNEKFKGNSIEDMLTEIKPVYQLKGFRIED